MTATVPTTPTLGQAFRYWLKLGFISFGGPAGQIALMHQELVEKRRWISERRYLHALNYCMLLPGPEAIQLATYIGWLLHGIRGALVAGVLFFLPAFLLLSLLAGVYLSWGHLPALQGVFHGIKPAVVAVVLFAAWRIGRRTIRNGYLLTIAVLAFVGIFFLNIGFPWIVLGAGLLGALGGRLVPAGFMAAAPAAAQATPAAPALIDDQTPPPAHARFSWKKLTATLLIFLLVWAGTLSLLAPLPALWDMGVFFTKAAFLTLGGAYAVLPYVYAAAVDHYGWLTGPQMMDGLALGETTPGPLIMVVTWVGYLGGIARSVLPDPLAAGLAGATVATFFTLLPSFFFILAGGPLVEASRDELRFTAPLTAIGAAVVGVIVHLGVFFAWHAFWPGASNAIPFAGPPDLAAMAMAVAAGIALWRYRLDIITVIAAGAVLGLGWSILG